MVVWKDAESELMIDLNSMQAAELLRVEAASFVDMEDWQKQKLFGRLIGNAYKILFEKVRLEHTPPHFHFPLHN
jgi:hypothetical protein